MNASQPVAPPPASPKLTVAGFIQKYWADYAVLLLAAAVIVSLDQWSKAWVRAHVPLGGEWVPPQLDWLMPYARLRFWYNSGAAFGLFKNGNLVFSILAVVVACAILYYLPRVGREWWLRLALALMFSGALGNLVDRILFARVTDFISVGDFAIFNVADSCVTVGVVVLVAGVFISEQLEKRRLAAAAPREEQQGG